ncbi:MAG: hypothetical protein KDA66_13755, partial [Planctomycetaceae bacterium]|nr:hypothetical protein [Planctomycetaceae bacterium]
ENGQSENKGGEPSKHIANNASKGAGIRTINVLHTTGPMTGDLNCARPIMGKGCEVWRRRASYWYDLKQCPPQSHDLKFEGVAVFQSHSHLNAKVRCALHIEFVSR